MCIRALLGRVLGVLLLLERKGVEGGLALSCQDVAAKQGKFSNDPLTQVIRQDVCGMEKTCAFGLAKKAFGCAVAFRKMRTGSKHLWPPWQNILED
jgi:hypothetical protein